MAEGAKPPQVVTRFACIVNADSVELAAVISSYLFEPGRYTPMFLLPKVKVPRNDNPDFMTESYVASLTVGNHSIVVLNALARLGEPEYVILAGLTDCQKSYLEISKRSTVIEIEEMSGIEPQLSPLVPKAKGQLRCRPHDVVYGLFIAQKRQKRLRVDGRAPALPEVLNLEKGMVVIENVPGASPVIAVNYANSINASVLLVPPLEDTHGRDVQTWIQGWKENHDDSQFARLKKAVLTRISSVSFSQFEYATFFTEGLPYALILKNIVPCTHVHLSIKPDLFIVNSLLSSDDEHVHAAVVFSPIFFADEETDWLCNVFTRNNYYLRPLIGQKATLATFDFHVQFFPYDLLHVCSHGGEVDGYEMTASFTDKDGKTHEVEFEEVIGVTPAPDKPDMVAVHRKVFPRKLDGLGWQSAEQKLRTRAKGPRKRKGRINMSCAIACADSIHQGQFHTLASHSSPVIYNNSCWSWYEIAMFFLACGARGYIGTLWPIGNKAAVTASQVFYGNVFAGSVLQAFYKAIKAIDGTDSQDVYIYWGLHFTMLSRSQNIEVSQTQVRRELMRAVSGWVRKIETTKNPEVRRNSITILKSILQELRANFDSGEIREYEARLKDKIPALSEPNSSRGTQQQDEEQPNLCSADSPIEYRTKPS